MKEFHVIAQDLSSYGLDKYKSLKLPELIERIADIPGVEWIRLHYAYPAQFPYDMLLGIVTGKQIGRAHV